MKDKRIVATYLIWTFGTTWLFESILIILDKTNVLSEYPAAFAVIMIFAVFGPAIGAYQAWHNMGEIAGIKSYIQKEIGSKSWKRTASVVLVIMILMLCIDYLLLERTDEKWYLFILYESILAAWYCFYCYPKCTCQYFDSCMEQCFIQYVCL